MSATEFLFDVVKTMIALGIVVGVVFLVLVIFEDDKK